MTDATRLVDAATGARAGAVASALVSAIGEHTLVVLHSAIPAFGMFPHRLREDWLAAVARLADAGITLALPAFTFSFCKRGWYHFDQSPSETGLLADWVWRSGAARRTPHPVYSFAVVGPLKEVCCAWNELGAFGAGTLFELFDRVNARIVFAGATWQSCTQVHRYEELAEVPYRYRKDFAGTADFGAGPGPVCARLCVRDVALGSTLNYTRPFDRLRREGRILRTKLERGTIESVSSADVSAVCMDLLREDPFCMLDDPRLIEQRLALRGHARD